MLRLLCHLVILASVAAAMPARADDAHRKQAEKFVDLYAGKHLKPETVKKQVEKQGEQISKQVPCPEVVISQINKAVSGYVLEEMKKVDLRGQLVVWTQKEFSQQQLKDLNLLRGDKKQFSQIDSTPKQLDANLAKAAKGHTQILEGFGKTTQPGINGIINDILMKETAENPACKGEVKAEPKAEAKPETALKPEPGAPQELKIEPKTETKKEPAK